MSNAVGKTYLWSKLSSIRWLDAWEERFQGDCRAVIEEIKGGKSIRLQVYTQTEQEAREIQDQFGGSIRAVNSKEWDTPQELRRKPLFIRDRLVLTQSTDPKVYDELSATYPERIVLQIPAEMAFGTGDHPTTATCLRFLVDYAKKQRADWSVLDVGCGTGVIAVAAARLGATAVEAFDFDEKAVEVARKNCRENEAGGVQLSTADVFEWQSEKRFDFIAANLFSSILQRAFPRFVQSLKASGTLIVSGILAEQWEQTEKSGREAGLSFEEVRRKGKWVSARAKSTN